jgi:hypothetical protein
MMSFSSSGCAALSSYPSIFQTRNIQDSYARMQTSELKAHQLAASDHSKYVAKTSAEQNKLSFW